MVKLYTHPEFKEKKNKYLCHYDLYKGDKEALTKGYLIPHIIESLETALSKSLLTTRQKRTEYTNQMEMVISSYAALFIKDDLNISELEPIFEEEEMANVDGKGKSLIQFIKEDVLVDYLLYGKPYILTDANNVQAKTGLESRLLGQRPFWSILNPLNVPDWSTKGGSYTAIRYEYWMDDERVTLEDEPKQSLYSKAYILNGASVRVVFYKRKNSQNDTKTVSTDADEWVKIDEVPIAIDEIPVATVWDQDSWVKDVAPLCRRYYNLESNYDNILLHQGQQRIFIATDMAEEAFLKVGEQVIGKLNQGDTLLQVEPVDTSSIERRLEMTMLQIYKVAFNNQRQAPADAKGVASDKTQITEKKDMLAQVVSGITEIEDTVNRAVQHWAKFKGKANFTGKIKLSKDITEEDIDQVSRLFLSHQSYIGRYPTWTKSYLKKIAYAQNLDDTDKIIKEIESGETYNPEQAIKDQMGLAGKAVTPLKDKITATNDKPAK